MCAKWGESEQPTTLQLQGRRKYTARTVPKLNDALGIDLTIFKQATAVLKSMGLITNISSCDKRI
jgi:hypothetical protein